MPAQLHNVIVQVEDPDDATSYVLSVDYDLNGSNVIEDFSIEITKAVKWWGPRRKRGEPVRQRYGGDIDLGDNAVRIAELVAVELRAEILEAVRDERERLAYGDSL